MRVELRGYRGRVADVPGILRRVAGLAPRAEVQLLRADRILGEDHLQSAILHADRAFAAGRNAAAAWPLEVLRYAAGERQLGKALSFLGLAEGVEGVAAVVRGDAATLDALAAALGWTRDDRVLAATPTKLDAWRATDAERAAFPPERVADFALERVALADVAR